MGTLANHIFLKNDSPRWHTKSPITLDVFQPIPGLIYYAWYSHNTESKYLNFSMAAYWIASIEI